MAHPVPHENGIVGYIGVGIGIGIGIGLWAHVVRSRFRFRPRIQIALFWEQLLMRRGAPWKAGKSIRIVDYREPASGRRSKVCFLSPTAHSLFFVLNQLGEIEGTLAHSHAEIGAPLDRGLDFAESARL